MLQAEIDKHRIVSKSRKRDNGSAYGGQPLGRGALYAMLSNRLYRGEIVHKGIAHPGQHDPIIDEVLFNDVQEILAANRATWSVALMPMRRRCSPGSSSMPTATG
ncbi:recombinase family protein [Mesorhizobium sp. BR1-1-16]|uniref:recombinase family protein n=1 Tax=Mesorhizobium sp. BR1-1-16 TaxID=2876653 RepID=UPI0025704A1E|nr:recombinase family protein [Mesorhizobium sp. BR1-1-16]